MEPKAKELADRARILRYAIQGLVVYIALGGIFYHLVEKWSWLDSFYFSVITVATVGYGDFSPHTSAGKIFTMLYVFFGIALFVGVANLLLRRRAGKVHSRRNRDQRGVIGLLLVIIIVIFLVGSIIVYAVKQRHLRGSESSFRRTEISFQLKRI